MPTSRARVSVAASRLHSNLRCACRRCHFARVDEFDELPTDAGASRRLSVLFLVAELEEAIRRGGIAWIAADAALIVRVANLMAALHDQIEGDR
jgi:hypothetical protein